MLILLTGKSSLSCKFLQAITNTYGELLYSLNQS